MTETNPEILYGKCNIISHFIAGKMVSIYWNFICHLLQITAPKMFDFLWSMMTVII